MADKKVENNKKSTPADKDAKSGASVEKKDNFRYIVRILSTDLDGNRKAQYALTGIKGIGNRIARAKIDVACVWFGYSGHDL